MDKKSVTYKTPSVATYNLYKQKQDLASIKICYKGYIIHRYHYQNERCLATNVANLWS